MSRSKTMITEDEFKWTDRPHYPKTHFRVTALYPKEGGGTYVSAINVDPPVSNRLGGYLPDIWTLESALETAAEKGLVEWLIKDGQSV